MELSDWWILLDINVNVTKSNILQSIVITGNGINHKIFQVTKFKLF